MNNFAQGARYLLTGFGWLGRPKLRLFVIIPLLVNMLIFGLAIFWGGREFGLFMEQLISQLPGWLDWLRWLFWVLFALTVLVILFFAFTLVANLIASPFNGLLAEQVEKLARPDTPLPPGSPIWKEALIAIATELIKLGYFLIWALPLLVLFFIPGINVIAPLPWALFTAWMFALQYADYPMGNHGIRFREQRGLLRKQRPLALGFGAAVLFFTLIPVVNFFVMPAAVIGATLMWAEQFASEAEPQAE